MAAPDPAVGKKTWRLGRLLRRSAWVALGLVVVAIACRYLGTWGLPRPGHPPGSIALDPTFLAPPRYEPPRAPALVGYRGPMVQGTLPAQDGRLFQDSPMTVGAFAKAWPELEPDLRAWVDGNRRAIREWRAICDREDPGDLTGAGDLGYLMTGNAGFSFVVLAATEGERLRSEGRLVEAWADHRRVLRAIRRAGNRRPLDARFALERFSADLVGRQVERWAGDPRVSVAELRRALRDIRALDAVPENDAAALDAEYVRIMLTLDRGSDVVRRDFAESVERALNYEPGAVPPGTGTRVAGPLDCMRRFLLNEPERSRRVAGLYFENWRPRLEALRTGQATPAATPTGFYPHQRPLINDGPAPPRLPGGLTPARLAMWHESTVDAKWLLPDLVLYENGLRLRKLNHGTQVMRLVEAICARENEGPPPTDPEGLLGPDLPALPEAYRPR